MRNWINCRKRQQEHRAEDVYEKHSMNTRQKMCAILIGTSKIRDESKAVRSGWNKNEWIFQKIKSKPSV